jgi:hypothetical protein
MPDHRFRILFDSIESCRILGRAETETRWCIFSASSSYMYILQLTSYDALHSAAALRAIFELRVDVCLYRK